MPFRWLLVCVPLSLFLVTAPAHANSASKYGTRPVTSCPSEAKAAKEGPPPTALVYKLVKCDFESDTGSIIDLMDKLEVRVGSPIYWSAAQAKYSMPDIDRHFPLYPIRSSFIMVDCHQETRMSYDWGKNCDIQRITRDGGFCYHTAFGDWQCALMAVDMKGDPMVMGQPPPPGTAAH